MVEVFGKVKSSTIENGTEQTVFRIPALSEGLAKRRGQFNARLKGLSNSQIKSIERVETGKIPGQSIYDVTVVSAR